MEETLFLRYLRALKIFLYMSFTLRNENAIFELPDFSIFYNKFYDLPK